jgi:hypothetical protein
MARLTKTEKKQNTFAEILPTITFIVQKEREMTKPNYKQLYARKKEVAQKLKKVCPNINNNSGIYFYTREKSMEEGGGRAFYIGKSRTLLDRCIAHDMGYAQRIDISLKKRKYYSESNPYGWKLNVLTFPERLLDEKERYYIDLYVRIGGECYNKENGGTTGKQLINERKPPKSYTDGLKQGRKNAVREVKVFFDKYLDYSVKGVSNKIKERKYNEFKEWLEDGE